MFNAGGGSAHFYFAYNKIAILLLKISTDALSKCQNRLNEYTSLRFDVVRGC